MLLPLINFHKFIIGDKKWVLYDNLKRRKSLINQLSDQPSTSTAKLNIYAKKFLMKVKAELIYTSNR